MAERVMQMGATQEQSGAHPMAHGHVENECPQRHAGGLDTGARGWRFAYSQPVVQKQMQATNSRD